ncbi:hypothetical protein QVD17_30172 [Tagetes erecta]|uniref:Uncharacterized protein n=1 Tax=Tagetes erecta TaxID=13708 RepID=A0AAD8K316_TARER|nr:hypothetical protein QVD17_30172 [Tagetes erecta]
MMIMQTNILEDIIEYYKHTEDELVEASASGNHLLIRAVSQYSLPHQDNDQIQVTHVDEVDRDNQTSKGTEQ